MPIQNPSKSPQHADNIKNLKASSSVTLLLSLDSLLSPLIHSLQYMTWSYILEPFLGSNVSIVGGNNDGNPSPHHSHQTTSFSYSQYLSTFLYNNNIAQILNNMGLIITTRMEIDVLVEKQEEMFLEALGKCFGVVQSSSEKKKSASKKAASGQSQNQTTTHMVEQDIAIIQGNDNQEELSYKEKRNILVNQWANEHRDQWKWIKKDLRSWLKGLKRKSSSSSSSGDSSITIDQIIACVDLTHKQAEYLIHSCLKLDKYIDAIISSCSLPKPKPHPQVYQYAMEELELNPKTDVICIEGSVEGIIAAKMAGIGCILGVRLESPIQKQKDRILVADHEDFVREETMQMLSEGAFTVIRDLDHLKKEYLGPILESSLRKLQEGVDTKE